jgi:hypothetical protein
MAKVRQPKKPHKSAPLLVSHTSLDKPSPGLLAPLNFKVPKDFRRAFKTYASQHDLKMVELLQQGFLLVKERHGE